MPNIATVLKDEVLRLARKEVRVETEGLKKVSAHYRSEIAAMKRRLSELEKQIQRGAKKVAKADVAVEPAEGAHFRFGTKGFAKLRQKLDLSAGELGKLLDVSAQTIYNWEAGKARPRQKQLAALAAVRTLGKREIKARLGLVVKPVKAAAVKPAKVGRPRKVTVGEGVVKHSVTRTRATKVAPKPAKPAKAVKAKPAKAVKAKTAKTVKATVAPIEAGQD